MFYRTLNYNISDLYLLFSFAYLDATQGNLFVKVFNLTWVEELTDNTTYDFLRHATPFCADVSWFHKQSQNVYTY